MWCYMTQGALRKGLYLGGPGLRAWAMKSSPGVVENKSQRHSTCEKDLMCMLICFEVGGNTAEGKRAALKAEGPPADRWKGTPWKELNSMKNRNELRRGPRALGESAADPYLDFSRVRPCAENPSGTSYFQISQIIYGCCFSPLVMLHSGRELIQN